MTLKQHIEFGQKVKEFREALMQGHVMNIGKKTSRANRSVHKVRKYLDQMKNELDSFVCNEFPDSQDPQSIYYGMSKKWIKQNKNHE